MRKPLIYIAGLLLIMQVVSGCQEGERPFNSWKHDTGVEDRGLLAFEMEGEEEKLQPWVDTMKARFGVPQVTFLHFQLETFEAFFDPEHRAINPEIVSSPYGLQKILVWKGIHEPSWSADSLQMSVQIDEHRMGKRPVDPYACRIELRLRDSHGNDLLATPKAAQTIREDLQQLVEHRLGSPHDTTPDPELPARIADYEQRKAAYALRVQDFLDPKCYPAVLHFPGNPNFRMQICEHDGMQDTLHGSVRVLSEAGDELPYVLYDYINDTVVREITILDGIVGYQITFRDIREVQEIWFDFPDGRQMKYYEKGDYTKYPMPYKPRYSPEIRKKRREKRLHEQLREQEKVMS